MEIKILKAEERKYTFLQSPQIQIQSGLIGHLRAEIGDNCNEFCSRWFDFRFDLRTTEFRFEFDNIIKTLRAEGQILHNLKSLAQFCYSTPESDFGSGTEYYGFRMDTEEYAYLLRLIPNKCEFNLYCFCYVREWLDNHLKRASSGIRFVDAAENELFRIPDGGRIEVIYFNGEKYFSKCRYVDDNRVEIGNHLYHISKFAERMAADGSIYRPVDGDADYYEIYQIGDIGGVSYTFMPYQENKIKREDYSCQYRGMLAKNVTLDDLYEVHNRDGRPFADRMRSMSVSDIIVIHRDGKAAAYYVDSFGFKEVTMEFLI